MKSIFISSTFKDMQAERDLLHEKIFPRLRRMIAEHGEDVQELKAKIREKKNAVILEYDAKWDCEKNRISGVETFGEELYGILEQMIREEYKEYEKIDWREKILAETERTKEQYLSSYVERPVEEAS